jgi:lycopene beta-cyclase
VSQPKQIKYDYIIAGMGASGLSLAMRLAKSAVEFSRILIIDKAQKNKNDRTWCFWTTETNDWYAPLIKNSWQNIAFNSTTYHNKFNIAPYTYVLIKGIDFYDYCLSFLQKDPRFEFITDNIVSIATLDNWAELKTLDTQYSAKLIFNSAFRTTSIKKHDINYVQHFKGWVIETNTDIFDETCPVFMDFNTQQFNDCRFFYVIPFSKNKALVEYTGFSKEPIPSEDYDKNLTRYIQEDLGISDYTVVESEYGEIPMMESLFINPFGAKVINIGTSGGNSKPSTGYTFYFIQKSTAKIIQQLEKKIAVTPIGQHSKFKLYDKVLLDVIDKQRLQADTIFTALFKKNKIQNLLRFLNEETSFIDDIKILNSVPKKAFITSALLKLLGK